MSQHLRIKKQNYTLTVALGSDIGEAVRWEAEKSGRFVSHEIKRLIAEALEARACARKGVLCQDIIARCLCHG